METGELPRWYLEESGPRLRRLDELSDTAYPDAQELPTTPEGREAMIRGGDEWDRLMRAQTAAEVAAGL